MEDVRFIGSDLDEPEADLKGIIDSPHGSRVECAQTLHEAFTVYRSNLIQDHG
jgi:hypothetical protein